MQKTLQPVDYRTHNIIFKRTRPNLTIEVVSGTSTNRGYHETYYRVTSWTELNSKKIDALGSLGLLGSGQQLDLVKTERIVDHDPAVVVDKFTGAITDIPPVNPYGRTMEPMTQTADHEYFVYTLRRICDSGD